MPLRIVVATRNRKKLGELVELLALPDVELLTLDGFPQAPEIFEDGATFLANAEKKAIETARALGQWALGEDSGLCVDALGGAPGIYSARFAGEPSSDEANNDLLLAKLADVPDGERGAHYVCTIAVADPEGVVRATAEGECQGRIGRERRGAGGFGYDPLFFPAGRTQTFGELPPEFKRAHSHRVNAVRALRVALVGLLG